MALRNVTVTLDEESARWARVEAARRDMSLSGMIRELIRKEMVRDSAYHAARERWMRGKAGVYRRSGERLPSRQELHER